MESTSFLLPLDKFIVLIKKHKKRVMEMDKSLYIYI